MKTIMLGIGDFGSTNVLTEQLKTMALGSCVAIIIMDPVTKLIGMDHIALPESSVNKDKSLKDPGYFADTGIPKLIAEMKRKGMKTPGPKLFIKLVGGAKVMDSNNTFNIGKRNVIAIKKILWKFGMGPRATDVGGNISRTVSVDVETGTVKINAPGQDVYTI